MLSIRTEGGCLAFFRVDICFLFCFFHPCVVWISTARWHNHFWHSSEENGRLVEMTALLPNIVISTFTAWLETWTSKDIRTFFVLHSRITDTFNERNIRTFIVTREGMQRYSLKFFSSPCLTVCIYDVSFIHHAYIVPLRFVNITYTERRRLPSFSYLTLFFCTPGSAILERRPACRLLEWWNYHARYWWHTALFPMSYTRGL